MVGAERRPAIRFEYGRAVAYCAGNPDVFISQIGGPKTISFNKIVQPESIIKWLPWCWSWLSGNQLCLGRTTFSGATTNSQKNFPNAMLISKIPFTLATFLIQAVPVTVYAPATVMGQKKNGDVLEDSRVPRKHQFNGCPCVACMQLNCFHCWIFLCCVCLANVLPKRTGSRVAVVSCLTIPQILS